ncbi:MAG TPA: thiamine phosphate synthase [Polyangiaceae bacterium]|jgi:thiamine-phosphate pyrophosphorylase|nr:thiamine phosphate synthase [Polyangiaceae bacterium]
MKAASRLHPRLIVITDTTVAPEGLLEERVERLLAQVRPGTVLVQLRDLHLPFPTRRALGERLMTLCHRHQAWFSVNDRVDLAVVLGADGVHLGERGVSPVDVRTLLPRAFVSHACHVVDQVPDAASNAALLSPVLAPRKGAAALGLKSLRDARNALDVRDSSVSLYALGGVDATNAAECLSSGATGVAVIGAALDGRDPTPLVHALGIGG